jgi:peptide chain release factor 1
MDPERLAAWRRERDAVLGELSDPSVVSDRTRFEQASRRHKELDELIDVGGRLYSAESDVATAREMLVEAQSQDRDLVREELTAAEESVAGIESELRNLLVPRDPNDGRNVIMEIRGAEGGEEANLFARDLFEMYSRFAERNHWPLRVLSRSNSDHGGLDEIVFVVQGRNAWQRLKNEGGTHRVQRVPVTESQGRVHTSAATVTVLPEAAEVEVKIEPSDLRVDVFRSTGPGGQSVNTTDSAVRVTHIPTGIVVAMQDEKSQLQNRAKAMQVLRARLLKAEQDRQAAEQSLKRRTQVGAGGRSEKVRTYNFKENRVTDHRIKLTLHKLDRVLDGELDEVVDALLADEHSRQLEVGADSADARP